MQPVLFLLFMCATCIYADFATDFDFDFFDEDDVELKALAGSENKEYFEQSSYITQPRDHFDQTDDHTFQQFYIYHDEFFANQTSPVLMLTIGYGPLEFGKTMTEIARLNNATIFALRHRYYEESNVTSDLSLENMKYLSSRQSLADMANFIVQTNKNYDNPRWIVYGCSYPGNLAAWFRLKYPHLTVGAVAFSAPVEAKFDFWEYNEVAKDALKQYNSSCAEDLNSAVDEIMSQNLTEIELEYKLGLCSPIEYDSSGFSLLLLTIHWGFSNQAFSKRKFEKVCAGFHTPLSGIRNFLLSHSLCADVEFWMNTYQNKMMTISTEDAFARSWAYQKCTEFGYFKTIPGFIIRSMIDFFCSKVFGSKFNEETVRKSVEATNVYYGGKAISDTITNTLSVNEEFDPWGNLSVGLQMKDKWSKSIVMRDAGHCAGSGRNNSSPDRNSTIDTITQYVGMWLLQAKPSTISTATPNPTTTSPEASTSTSTPDPTTKSTEPSTSTPDPTTKSPKPLTSTPEPTTTSPEASTSTSTPVPTTKSTEPSTSTPDPTTKSPEPSTSTPDLTATSSEPLNTLFASSNASLA